MKRDADEEEELDVEPAVKLKKGNNRGLSSLKGLRDFAAIVQDEIAFARALLYGLIVAERKHIRLPNKEVPLRQLNRISSETDRGQLLQIYNKLRSYRRSEKVQTKDVNMFCLNTFGVLPERVTYNEIERIQEILSDYRIIIFKYYQVSGQCSLIYYGQEVREKAITLVTDGTKWSCLSATFGVFDGQHFCRACLKTSRRIGEHRCQYTCSSCSSLLITGRCLGNLRKECKDCGFIFRTEECFRTHKELQIRSYKSRCDTRKICKECGAVYSSSVVHVCGEGIYCTICQDYTNDQHVCNWPAFTETQKEKNLNDQENFLWAFYDIETVQTEEDEQTGIFNYLPHHFCSTICLIKVCKLCAGDTDQLAACAVCGERTAVFSYTSAEDPDDKVAEEFCKYLITDKTMDGRTLFAHNGGRFDVHLVIDSFLKLGVIPKIMCKSTNIVRAEVKVRGRKKLVFKDSYSIIPMALAAFPSAFNIPSGDKGTFPYLVNMRKYWGKVWPSIPDRKYFNYAYMKADAQQKLDEWLETVKDKEWNQDEEVVKYCVQDVRILMMACLEYSRIMKAEVGYCPLFTSNTLAAFCLFQLRTTHLTPAEMPNLPEAGYGALNQSKTALRYVKYLEKIRGRKLRHAHSPYGEKKVRMKSQRLSLDCYDKVEDEVIEIMGCYFHGCPRCYPPGAVLVGEEHAGVLLARTNARIAVLRSKFDKVTVIWECEIREMCKASVDMLNFFKEVEVVGRLVMREGLYGGRVEVLRAYLKKSPDYIIREYPVGHPKIICSQFEEVIGEKLPYRGLIKLKILAPQSLRYAVLPYRFNDVLYFPLCARCVAENESMCRHQKESDRAWIGTYTTAEVELALREGYRVLRIYEVWHWDIWSSETYKSYFRTFMKIKFTASGFPAGIVSDAEKEHYCATIGSNLGFTLNKQEVAHCPARRTVAKLCNNSAWGKLAESPLHQNVEFVSEDRAYELMTDPKIEVRLLVRQRPGILKVWYKPNASNLRSAKYSAVHHAIHVTSYARCLLYEILKKVGSGAAYMDTDSIIYGMSTNAPNPLEEMITNELGGLSDEMKDGWDVVEAVFAGYLFLVRM